MAYGSDAESPAGRAFFEGRGRLADGSQARNLVLTQPDASSRGFIQGVFPRFKVGSKARFLASVALAADTAPSSAVDLEVKVLDDGTVNPVARHRIAGTERASFDADLSRWSGKTVQLVVKTRTQSGRRAPVAVWIDPKVTYED